MTKLDGAQVNAGVHLLLPSGDLDDTGSTLDTTALGGGLAPIGGNDNGNPYSASPIPNLFAVTPVKLGGQKIWAGIGVTAPFGLGSDYDDDSTFRFDSTETELLTINVAPSLAYKINDRISIGGGVDIQYADAELQNIVNFGLGESISTLDGDDISVGYNIGVQVQATPATEIGLHYRSAISHDLDGDISLVGSGALDFNEGGSADLDLPDILTLGAAHDVNDKLRVMGQATWFGWNNFQTIAPERDSGAAVEEVVQDYDNTFAVAVGAEYELNDTWTVRAGYQFDETPTTDEFRTSRTPDGDRHWFSGGGTYKLNDKIEFDFAATYIDIGDETINVTRNAPVNNAQVSADTDGYVGIVAAGINYKF